MKTLIAMICLLALSISSAETTITYQGQLQDGTGPFTGAVDLQFGLYDSDEGGSLVAGPVDKEAVNVVDGLFQVELDFGNSIGGQARWLQIEVEGTVLATRQRISAVPLALKALDTGPDSPFEDIGGNAILQQGRVGIGITEPNFALEIGNIEPITINDRTFTAGGTIRAQGPGTAIGLTSQGFTTDDPNEETSYGVIASNNTVEGAALWGAAEHSFGANIGVRGSTQSQDGFAAYFTGRESSRNYFQRRVGIGVEDPGAMLQVEGNLISGHLANSAAGTNSFVAGGASGMSNRADGERSFVGGGQGNAANESESFVGSGFENTANGTMSFVGGGFGNTAGGFRSFSGGGENNIASGLYSFVGGGVSNEASGDRSFVGGGSNNSASGNFSFAAGRRAKAAHRGSFVWADRHSFSGLDFSSTGGDQFLIRAGGGVGIGTNAPETDLHIKARSSSAALILENASDVNGWGIGTGLASGNFNFYYNADVSGFTTSGTRLGGISNTTGEYSANSDRRLKTDIEPLEDVLASVLQLEPASYRFLRSGNNGKRSIGFIAQDVEQVFPEVVDQAEEDDYLSLVYANFSVLAIGAIQEQQVLIETQADEIAALNDRIDRLEQMLTADR